MKLQENDPTTTRLGEVMREAHHRLEAASSGRISQAEMAARLGVSQRAYANYLRGQGPTGVRVAFEILSMLDEVEAIRLLRKWRDWNEKTKLNLGK